MKSKPNSPYVWKYSTRLFLMTLILGWVIIYIVIKKASLYPMIFSSVKLSFKEVMFNNYKCAAVYMIPIVGWFYYLLAMIYSFIVIGLSVKAKGWGMTFFKLWHLPVELYAFSLLIVTSITVFLSKYKRLSVKQIVFMLTNGLLLLALAAMIESRL